MRSEERVGLWGWAVSLGAAFLVFGVFAASAGVAGAQSGGGFVPLFEREAGPFAVGMGWTPAAPQVGFVNVGVAPRALASGEPVTDARVTVRATPQHDVSEAFEVVAVNTPVDPTVYRANMKFEHADNWVLDARIESPSAGAAGFETPLVVLPPPIESEAVGGWVFLGVFAVLAAGAGYLVWSARRARGRREELGVGS